MPGNVVLIGFSGTGKSKVGRQLAHHLGWHFLDADEEIVAVFGKSIDRIFAEEGEERFRAVEREVVERACSAHRCVVSVGGGAVVDPRNREHILRGNWVVHLDASPEVILRRLRSDPETEVRPLLAVQDPLGRITALKAAREQYYRMTDWRIDTDALTTEEVAEKILARLKA